MAELTEDRSSSEFPLVSTLPATAYLTAVDPTKPNKKDQDVRILRDDLATVLGIGVGLGLPTFAFHSFSDDDEPELVTGKINVLEYNISSNATLANFPTPVGNSNWLIVKNIASAHTLDVPDGSGDTIQLAPDGSPIHLVSNGSIYKRIL